MKNTENHRNTIILTERESAARLSIGYSTLKRWRHAKKIDFVRIGNHRIGYKLKNLTDFIDKNSVES